MIDLAAQPDKTTRRDFIFAIGVCVVVALVVIKVAWLADDASITSRVVANTLNGYGPTFNITERAQAMTHPLWFLAVTILSLLGVDIVLALLLLGLVCTITTTWLLVRNAPPVGAAVLCVLFVFSFTLTEYGTSGLENSLSWLLLTLTWLKAKAGRPYLVGLFAGLAVLNRLDVAVVAIPFLVLWVRGQTQPVNRVRLAALIAFPPMCWATFSWLYYGSPLPETFFAKLNTEIATSEVLGQGVYYLYDLLRFDLISGLILLAGALVAIRGLVSRESRLLVATGSGLYSAYVIWIGGDFMSGRMWSIPIVCSFIALADWSSNLDFSDLRTSRTVLAACAIPVLALPLFVPWNSLPILRSPIDPASRGNGIGSQNSGIVDEWAYYVQDGRGLIQWVSGRSTTLQDMSTRLESWPTDVAVDEVRVRCDNVGWAATMSGPRIHYVVHCGLSDPFLARLPFKPGTGSWRIGHYYRDVPDGYLEALATGDRSFVAGEFRRLFVETSLDRRVEERWAPEVRLRDR